MSCLLMLCCSPSRSPTVAMTAFGLMNWLARRHSFWRGDVCLLEWSVVVGETISLMLRLKTGCCRGSLCGAGIGSCAVTLHKHCPAGRIRCQPPAAVCQVLHFFAVLGRSWSKRPAAEKALCCSVCSLGKASFR